MAHGPATVAEKLAAALQSRGPNGRPLALRALARKLDPERVETVRRQLYRYLNEGVEPEDEMAERLAAALEYPRDHFKASRAPRQARIQELEVRLVEVEAQLAALRDQARRGRRRQAE